MFPLCLSWLDLEILHHLDPTGLWLQVTEPYREGDGLSLWFRPLASLNLAPECIPGGGGWGVAVAVSSQYLAVFWARRLLLPGSGRQLGALGLKGKSSAALPVMYSRSRIDSPFPLERLPSSQDVRAESGQTASFYMWETEQGRWLTSGSEQPW